MSPAFANQIEAAEWAGQLAGVACTQHKRTSLSVPLTGVLRCIGSVLKQPLHSCVTCQDQILAADLIATNKSRRQNLQALL